MATNFVYGTREAAVALLTTELNSLGNGSLSSASSAITPGTTTNLTTRHLRGDLVVKIASSSSAFVSGSVLVVYFIPAVDGTNYPKIGASLAKSNYCVASIALYGNTLSSEVLYECVTDVPIPNCPFKVVLENQSGVSLPASGNTLDLYPQAVQY